MGLEESNGSPTQQYPWSEGAPLAPASSHGPPLPTQYLSNGCLLFLAF